MAIINILDLDLYLIKFMDTKSIINSCKINKKSNRMITQLKLYQQLVIYIKNKTDTMINYAAINNCVELIDHLFLIGKYIHNDEIILLSIKSGSIDIFKWLHNRKLVKNFDCLQYAFQYSIENKINIIQYIINHYEINLDKRNNMYIFLYCDVDVFELLSKNNINIQYDLNDIFHAIFRNDKNVLTWLIKNNYNRDIFRKLLKWLFDNEYVVRFKYLYDLMINLVDDDDKIYLNLLKKY